MHEKWLIEEEGLKFGRVRRGYQTLYDDTDVAIKRLFSNLPFVSAPNSLEKKSAPIIFSKPTVNPTLKRFLSHVARGEQDEVEALLQENKDLRLAKGDLQDQAGRVFKDITAFQYAFWSLDWHMWKMIREYLSDSEAKAQLEGLETGSWVSTHGFSAKPILQELADALQTVITFIEKRQYNKADNAWAKYGECQKRLTAQVVNEYCHPTRSFDPMPSFREELLPRSQETLSGLWWEASSCCTILSGGSAVGRGSERLPMRFGSGSSPVSSGFAAGFCFEWEQAPFPVALLLVFVSNGSKRPFCSGTTRRLFIC